MDGKLYFQNSLFIFADTRMSTLSSYKIIALTPTLFLETEPNSVTSLLNKLNPILKPLSATNGQILLNLLFPF